MRVINSESGSDLEDYFGNGRQWGVNLSYGFAKPEDRLNKVLKKNRNYISEGVLIIYGYQFIKYDKHKSYDKLVNSGENQSFCEDDCGLYFINSLANYDEDELCKFPPIDIEHLGISRLESLHTFFEQSILILSKYRNNYVLPGYNNEDGAYLGKNIIDKKTTRYVKPILLGNNVQIQMNTLIGPNVVLGNNVIIDHSTQVRNSIIYDNSYIGSELEISNKIVYRRSIIDPASEEVMKIVDSFLVSDIQSNLIESGVMKFINSILAFLLIIFTTIPYFVMLFFCMVFGMKIKKGKYFTNIEGKIGSYPLYKLKGYNIFKRFFFRFSLDLYPLYFQVIKGKMQLVGNQRLLPEAGGIKVLMQLPAYNPGVYDYASSMLHNQEHENYLNDELEYIHMRSFYHDLKVILTFWINRLFSEWCSVSTYLREKK